MSLIRSLPKYRDGHGLCPLQGSCCPPGQRAGAAGRAVSPHQVSRERFAKCREVLGKEKRQNSISIMAQYSTIGCLHLERLTEILVAV